MQPEPLKPSPQPTESEAIVAALQQPDSSGAALAPPVPLPVDVAGDLPAVAPASISSPPLFDKDSHA